MKTTLFSRLLRVYCAFVVILIFGSFSNALAQPGCGTATGCGPGVFPGLANWNSPPNGAGVFVCAESLDNGCGCDEARNCQYIHIQNLTLSGTPGSPCNTGCVIDWIEVRFAQDANSTKFNICNPHKQWGLIVGPHYITVRI